MAAPTRLSGVDAPEVRPTDTGPVATAATRPPSTSAFAPTGRCRISSGDTQAVGVGDVIGRPRRGADPRQVRGVAAVVAADDDHQVDRLGRASSATTASCRSCVALQMVSNALIAARELGVAVAVAHRARGTSRRSRATRSSASSSGWRRPMRCEVAFGIEAGRGRVAERARRNALAVAAARGCSRRPTAASASVEHDQIAAAGTARACDAVACVSSCQTLPWMIDGEAVLARSGGRSSRRSAPSRRSCRPACSRVRSSCCQHRDGDAERRQDHDVVGGRAGRRARRRRSGSGCPCARSLSLTCGLWMISPVRNTVRSGKRSRV